MLWSTLLAISKNQLHYKELLQNFKNCFFFFWHFANKYDHQQNVPQEQARGSYCFHGCIKTENLSGYQGTYSKYLLFSTPPSCSTNSVCSTWVAFLPLLLLSPTALKFIQLSVLDLKCWEAKKFWPPPPLQLHSGCLEGWRRKSQSPSALPCQESLPVTCP